MNQGPYLLGVDIGGTGSKAGLYTLGGDLIQAGYGEYRMISTLPGQAEHDGAQGLPRGQRMGASLRQTGERREWTFRARLGDLATAGRRLPRPTEAKRLTPQLDTEGAEVVPSTAAKGPKTISTFRRLSGYMC